MEQKRNRKAPTPPADTLGDLLDFTPVPVRYRSDGWTPERQRRYVAALARWGNGRRAAAHVDMSEQSAARLRARPEGASFGRACERAWRIGKRARYHARRCGGAGILSPKGAELSENYETSGAERGRPPSPGAPFPSTNAPPSSNPHSLARAAASKRLFPHIARRRSS